MNKLLIAAVAVIFLLSCTKSEDISTCLDGKCDAKMIFPVLPDENGYYHVKLDWTREYLPYFTVEVEATPVVDEYRYNGISHVTAAFDSDTVWTIGEEVTFTEPLYNPFTSNVTGSGTTLSTSTRIVNLSQFSGMTLNIVQGTEIYFNEVNDKLYTKRVVGPIPPVAIGDTITLYMKVFWDAGSASQWNNKYFEKFIVE